MDADDPDDRVTFGQLVAILKALARCPREYRASAAIHFAVTDDPDGWASLSFDDGRELYARAHSRFGARLS